MAKDHPTKTNKQAPAADQSSKQPPSQHKKLARLPPSHKISKRPLLHPAIPSPRTSSSTPKVVYISASSPFISIIKRVRTLLSHVEDRAAGAVKLTRDGRDTFKLIEKGISNGGKAGEKSRPRDEEVQLRATGRAIAKALQVAIRLQKEEGWKVRFETASVGAVDDVVERVHPKTNKKSEKAKKKESKSGGEGEGMDVDNDVEEESRDVEMGDAGDANEGEAEEEDLEESRIRRVSCMIIYVGLR